MLLAVLSLYGQQTDIKIVRPTVERQDGSRALTTAQPRFGWQYESSANNVVQTAYRIIVSSTEQKAQKGVGDLWDSGEQTSSDMLNIAYQGKTLKSRDQAFWKIVATVTSGRRKTKVESQINKLEISLLEKEDWQAKWIGREFDDDILVGKTRVAARYLRKEFALRGAVREARLYVSGLGQYSAFLNGVEVASEELLKPALSDYHKRVYFNAFDVTALLDEGQNAIGVILAGGRYTAMRYNAEKPTRDGTENMQHYGTPRLLLQLEVCYQDGTREVIVSDETWKITNRGPIRSANEFDGETFDANLDLGNWHKAGYDDSAWWQAQRVESPGGGLKPQPNPNIRVMEVLKPVAIFQKGGNWYLDMGQNMVGVLNMKLRSQQPGDTVTLRFAELLKDDSTLYTANLRNVEATDRYIVVSTILQPNNSATQWHPQFVYHGFRYVEVSGLRGRPDPDDFEGWVLYDEMPVTGTFETSDGMLNAVYRNAYWGIRGNYRSMPTDCPQRDERMGWTGDRTTGAYGESYIFGNQQLYAKWLADFEDSQLESGALPDVVPAYWRFYFNSMTWPGAFITVADMLYTRFGDMQPIRQHYESMKKWMLFMKQKYMVDGIMTKDTYGDWCMPPESPELIHSRDTNRITEAAVISTPFYSHLAETMARFAEMLGKTEDREYFRYEKDVATASFNKRYFHRDEGHYANNTVTANLLPLWFGMVPEGMEERVFESIVSKTENEYGGHVSTGVIGIQQLMRTLTEHGRCDLALKMARNDTYPSWGYMVRHGATTIWELWNGNTANPAMNSGNHVMLLGDLILWEYEYLGGIRALEPGYRKIRLKPYPTAGLDYVNCAYESVSGRIESSWKCEGNRFEWDIVIPANTTAEVCLPTGNGYVVKTYGSGKYHLSSTLPLF